MRMDSPAQFWLLHQIGAGFPLVGLLNQVAEAQGNPSVTITGGRIAALKRDEHGQLVLLQVDGSLPPGNSDGPILEEKTGKLLGVAFASLMRSGICHVGFIVPADEVRQCLGGRVGAVEGTRLEGQKGIANLQVNAQIVDPRGTVQGVVVHITPASVGSISPNNDGWKPALDNTQPAELKRDAKTLVATGRVQMVLTGQA